MTKVRIGLVGAGAFARANHFPSLKAFPDVELAALSEISEPLRREVAAELAIPAAFSAPRDMIEKTAPDAAYAVLAPHRSYDVLLDLIKTGLPLFVEKPVVISRFQAESLAEAAAKSGARVMVGFNRRFMPVLVESLRRVGAAGALNHLLIRYHKHNPDASYYAGAVDFLRCDAIHAVDALRWIGGEVRDLAAVAACHNSPRANCISAVMRFDSGATGVLTCNWASAARVHSFELHAAAAAAYVDPDDKAVVHTAGADTPAMLDAAAVAGGKDIRTLYGFQAEDRYFIDCVKDGAAPQPDLADLVKTHALVDRIYASLMR